MNRSCLSLRSRVRRGFLSIGLWTGCVLAVSYPGKALADIPNLEWEETQEIDLEVEQVSGAAGVSSLSWNDAWYLVYVKSGSVSLAVHSDGQWQAPVQVSTVMSTASKPLVQLERPHG